MSRVRMIVGLILLVFGRLPISSAADDQALLPAVPDKLVVLTFDDSVKSHFTVVRPILLKYGFGATFFVTEGFDFRMDKQHYMTWEEIAHLDADGFEIGNHTRDHLGINDKTLGKAREQLQAINDRCAEFGIARPVSFAWPGNTFTQAAFPVMRELGIRFARRGGTPEYDYTHGQGFAWEPGLDHPLLIPSAGDARPDWTFDDFETAVRQAQFGRIAVLQFHGVPDLVHPHVNSPVKRFVKFMQYLAENDYTVVALRDVDKYIDSAITPKNPTGIIDDRKRVLAANRPDHDVRTPIDEIDLRRWLENMVWYHRFTIAEIRTATGLSANDIQRSLERFDIRADTRPNPPADAPLQVMPYPGGRHPRIGFLDGAIRPQRDTKLSVFLPWDAASYVVLDLPEALRRNDEAQHGLLYLAHTHVDTMWDRQQIALDPVEWQRHVDGSLDMKRVLPNGVGFGTQVIPDEHALRMRMWLHNGSNETLSNLRVQNCIMLKAAPEFADPDNGNKIVLTPYVAARSAAGNRWIITAWEPCLTAWSNPPCPCMHSDPQFPDCPPGESRQVRGWMSFYEGTDIETEFQRIDATGWRDDAKH